MKRVVIRSIAWSQEMRRNWRAVTDFFISLVGENPLVNDIVAEECAVLPGMEEAFGLMRLQAEVDGGTWDVIVVDTPPTGDLLKFLRLPDVLRWVMEKYHPLDRGLLRRIRPVAEMLHWPVPTDESASEMEHWYERVGQASRSLSFWHLPSLSAGQSPGRYSVFRIPGSWWSTPRRRSSPF